MVGADASSRVFNGGGGLKIPWQTFEQELFWDLDADVGTKEVLVRIRNDIFIEQ